MELTASFVDLLQHFVPVFTTQHFRHFYRSSLVGFLLIDTAI